MEKNSIRSVAEAVGIKLTGFQLIAANIVEWLFELEVPKDRSGPLFGRTTLLSLWAIAQSVNRPGEWVEVPDHMAPHYPDAIRAGSGAVKATMDLVGILDPEVIKGSFGVSPDRRKIRFTPVTH